MDIFEVIGIGGAIIVLLAYVGNEAGIINRKSFLYDGANVLAGLMLLSYSISVMSIPFIAINVVWTAIALRDVVLGVVKGRAI